MARELEEFGDYLLAHGAIASWQIRGTPLWSMCLEATIRSVGSRRITSRAAVALMDKPLEDLPLEYTVATNELAKAYIRLKLQGDTTHDESHSGNRPEL